MMIFTTCYILALPLIVVLCLADQAYAAKDPAAELADLRALLKLYHDSDGHHGAAVDPRPIAAGPLPHMHIVGPNPAGPLSAYQQAELNGLYIQHNRQKAQMAKRIKDLELELQSWKLNEIGKIQNILDQSAPLKHDFKKIEPSGRTSLSRNPERQE